MKNFVPQILLVFAILLLFITYINAQTPNSTNEEVPKVMKAVAVTKYPFGNFKGAKGDVMIQVKIDSKGQVISAFGISGHPLLRSICEKHAKRWLFNKVDKKSERTVTLTFTFTKAEKDEDEGIFFKPPYTVEMVDAEVR